MDFHVLQLGLIYSNRYIVIDYIRLNIKIISTDFSESQIPIKRSDKV